MVIFLELIFDKNPRSQAQQAFVYFFSRVFPTFNKTISIKLLKKKCGIIRLKKSFIFWFQNYQKQQSHNFFSLKLFVLKLIQRTTRKTEIQVDCVYICIKFTIYFIRVKSAWRRCLKCYVCFGECVWCGVLCRAYIKRAFIFGRGWESLMIFCSFAFNLLCLQTFAWYMFDLSSVHTLAASLSFSNCCSLF